MKSNKKSRYTVELFDGDWLCTDWEHGLLCRFENQNINEVATFTFVQGIEKPSDRDAARLYNEMNNWLCDNHPEKVLPPPYPISEERRIFYKHF